MLISLQRFAVLPAWLVGVTEREQVRRVLTYRIPEFASGALILQSGRIKNLHLSTDGTSWTGICYCTVTEPESQPRQVVALRAQLLPPDHEAPDDVRAAVPFGSDGWRWYVPELRVLFEAQSTETELAGLSQLTDPEQARGLLEQLMEGSAATRGPPHIVSCRPEVLRYHPGLRCTIQYHLTYAPEPMASRPRPGFVVAKTYEDDTGQRVYDSMKALWDSPLGRSPTVTIAEPLAYDPELKLLVQGPIPGKQILKTLIERVVAHPTSAADTELTAYLQKTAHGLATLHTCNVEVGTVHTWEDEAAGVAAFVRRLTIGVPALADAATPFFTYLHSVATAFPADAVVPTHGTFRPAQVLLDAHRIGFIDFDSFCQAEPAMDLALFMVSLIDTGMSVLEQEDHDATDIPLQSLQLDRLAQLDAMAETFLREYSALHLVSRPRVALWAALNMMELVVRCWERAKPGRLNHMMLMLERHLRLHLVV